RLLEFVDDVLGRHFLAEDLPQRRIAAARLIVLQTPVAAVDALHDQGVRPEDVARERRNRQAYHLSSFSSWSIISGLIAHSIFLLFCSITGASPQAPMHSPSFSVMRPSAVVSLKPMPSAFFRCSAA